ncbi:DgyrCDS9472 [Dimorphilus gyrociliatus]|uniref:DgyrCDS9472 n=1 Tax=Dimorphilus gyrociliatus TaxID=2664684 RepID=A0A7I8VZ95_9ANNE|nr:DgyrCDS9472 [Dimorphilus gyrociliatus]
MKNKLIGFMFLLCIPAYNCLGEVIYAVNCGGESHVDSHGIKYQRDPLNLGTASDYGRNLVIHRIPQQDQIIYQTERYHTDSFRYEIPINADGHYVLILKFSEVWFTAPNQKVFDVILNNDHTVVEGLDIFAKVGRGIAHDEYIPFEISKNKLKVRDESSAYGGSLAVEFAKSERDNPKINAIIIMRGLMEDIPVLPPLPGREKQTREEDEEEEEVEEPKLAKRRNPSGPKVQDPYASEDTGSMMLPILAAVGIFIPTLFCLCRL